ncbi:MAG: hypothetical protein U1E49_06750 [Hyphomicrobiaceae bacterium]
MPTEDLHLSLDPGERLLWSGRPRQGFVIRAVEVILTPFALFWGGVAAVFFWYVLNQPGEIEETKDGVLPLLLIGGAFVLAAFYMLIGRHITDIIRRANTVYGVTDRRVIIEHRSWPKAVRSIDLGHMPNLRLDESSAGRGTIEFYDTASFKMGTRTGVWHATVGQPPKLFEIEDARRVFEIIRREAGKAGKAA